MGNIGSFQNYCNCNQKNVIITSDFIISVQDSKLKYQKNEQTEETILKQNEITNPKRIIRFSRKESKGSLTPVLNKIDSDFKKFNFERAKTLVDKNNYLTSNRTNLSRRNMLLRKLTEKNKDENNDLIIIDNPIKTIEEESSPKKIINKKQSNEDKYKPFCFYSCGEISKDEEKFLFYIFYKHPIFMEYKMDFIKILIDNISIIEIQEKTCIFKKGEIGSIFFIIKEGEVSLKNEKNEKEKILSKGDSFGELAIFNFNSKRKYDAYSINKIKLYALTYETFQNLLLNHKDNLYINPNLNSHQIIDDNIDLIKKYYLFKNLEQEELSYLLSLIRVFQFKELGLLLSLSTFNSKSSSSFSNIKPFFRNNKDLLFVIKGSLRETFKTGENKLTIGKGECANIIFTFFQDKKIVEIKNKEENTIILLFSEKAFIESIGIDYKYQILFELYFENICKIDILSTFMGESTLENYKILFDSFSLNEYKKDEIIISKSSYENKKICIVLYGDLVKNNKIILSKGEIIGEELIDSLIE